MSKARYEKLAYYYLKTEIKRQLKEKEDTAKSFIDHADLKIAFNRVTQEVSTMSSKV